MNLVYISLAAFGGGILSALLGFLESKEKFDMRKFTKSVIFALLSAIGFAIGYSFTDGVTVRDILIGILAGAGVDSLSNRFMGAVK